MASSQLDIYEGPMAKTSGLSLGANPNTGIATQNISDPYKPPVDPTDPDL